MTVYRKSRASLFFLLFLTICYSVSQSITVGHCYRKSVGPYWLKPGVYVEYPIGSCLLTNGTHVEARAFRWECKDIQGVHAKILLKVILVRDGRDVEVRREVIVNTLNNSVYIPGSGFAGTTHLWLPPLLEPGKVFNSTMNPALSFNGFRLRYTICEVVNVVGAYGDYRQKAYEVKFTIYYGYKDEERRAEDLGFYDHDTGILLMPPHAFELTLLILNVYSIAVGGILTLSTNIDLGPPAVPPHLEYIAHPLTWAVIFGCITALLVFVRRRKKRMRGRGLRARRR